LIGLTPEEIAVIEKAGELYNDFVKLEVMHTADCSEITALIHAIQNMIMARAAVRAHPDIFHKFQSEK